MSPPILTREQADAVLAAAPGPAYLVVPGNPLPAEWVALTEPCETCERGLVEVICGRPECEDGLVYDLDDFDGRLDTWDACSICRGDPCTDCEGSGRRRFPITVNCTSDRFKPGFRMCSECGMTGQVTLGSAEVIKVLPVIEFVFGNEALTAGVPQAVIAEDGGCAVWDGAGDIIRIDPIGTPKPGGYIAVIADIKDAGI